MDLKLQLPCPNDHFGYRHGERDGLGRFHPGDDLNGPGVGDADLGIKIMSIGPGEVTYVSPHAYNGGWGDHVFTKHDLKALLTQLGLALPSWCPPVIWSHYAHLAKVLVKQGQKVGLDTQIGTMGKSGSADQYSNVKGRTWTAHLHWDMRNQPLGVNFYPPKSMTTADFNSKYVAPSDFIARFNAYVATAKPQSTGAQTDVLAEAKERARIDEEVIVALLGVIERITKQTDVSTIMQKAPWIKKS